MLKIKCVIYIIIFLVHYWPVSVTDELNSMYWNYTLIACLYLMTNVGYYYQKVCIFYLKSLPHKGLAYWLPDHVQPCQTANITQTGKCGQEYTKNSGKEMNLSKNARNKNGQNNILLETHFKWPTGRPKIHWEDDVKKDVQRLKVPNLKTLVQDRRSWKEVVEKAKTLH